MKYLLLFCALFFLLFSCPVLANTPEHPEYKEKEVMVALCAPAFEDYDDMSTYSQALLQQAEAFAKKYELELVSGVLTETARLSGKSVINLRSEHKSTEELIRELSSDPDVIYVEPNYAIYLDPDPEDPGCNVGYGSILFLIAALISLAKKK